MFKLKINEPTARHRFWQCMIKLEEINHRIDYMTSPITEIDRVEEYKRKLKDNNR